MGGRSDFIPGVDPGVLCFGKAGRKFGGNGGIKVIVFRFHSGLELDPGDSHGKKMAGRGRDCIPLPRAASRQRGRENSLGQPEAGQGKRRDFSRRGGLPGNTPDEEMPLTG